MEVGAEYLGGGEGQKEINVYLALKMIMAIYDVPDFTYVNLFIPDSKPAGFASGPLIMKSES